MLSDRVTNIQLSAFEIEMQNFQLLENISVSYMARMEEDFKTQQNLQKAENVRLQQALTIVKGPPHFF